MKETQGRRLIAALKRKPMTSMELQMLGISTCWWKRVQESLGPNERLIKGTKHLLNGKPLTNYKIIPL